MKRLGGPDLKLSKPRVPQPVADVYRDLRDRHLLPLVALIVVAIVAVPFLLGSDSEPVEGAPVAREVTRSLRSVAAGGPALTVVEAQPGVRDYRKRLKGRTSSNPFKQHHTAPSLNGARFQGEGGGDGGDAKATVKTGGSESSRGGSSGGGSSGGGFDETVTVPSGGSDGVQPAPGSGGGDLDRVRRGGLVLFDWGIDVRIRRIANGEKSEPLVRKRLLPQTALPGEKAPVVTYMGPARKGKKKINGRVLLLISDRVREVASDGRCVAGKGVCQLLEVTPGFPVVLTYGESEVRYVLSVDKLQLVITGRR